MGNDNNIYDEFDNTLIEEEYEEKDTLKDRYLTFELDNQTFAVAMEYVVDIINILPVTKVPNCPEFVMGITNLRGKVIPIVDLRLRFGKEKTEYTARTCLIVLELKNISVGFVIDRVLEALTIAEKLISPPPGFSKNLENRFISGIANHENGVVMILDCNIVFDDNLVMSKEEE